MGRFHLVPVSTSFFSSGCFQSFQFVESKRKLKLWLVLNEAGAPHVKIRNIFLSDIRKYVEFLVFANIGGTLDWLL